MIERQTWVQEDFSGGITDFPRNARANQCAFLENFKIDPNRKPYTRPGSKVYTDAVYRLPTLNLDRVVGLFEYKNFLFGSNGSQLFYTNGLTITELLGPTGNKLFENGTDDGVLSINSWNNHIFIDSDELFLGVKVFKNNLGNFEMRTVGLPKPVVGSITLTPSSVGTTNKYVYAIVYRSDYNVETVVFTDRSEVGRGSNLEVTTLNAIGVSGSQVTVGSIPVLANTLQTNYDTATLKVEIYRTTAGGQVFFLAGTITNGTTSFVDSMTDAVLQDQETLYTSGGAVEYTQPLPAKFSKIINGKKYSGVLQEGSELLENTIIESIQDDPDSQPATFRTQIDDVLKGIGGYNGLPIFFGATKVYRNEGEYSEDGQGFTRPREISPNAGCAGHNSVVSVRGGLVWVGNDGFYFTNGYEVQKISEHLDKTFLQFVLDDTRKKRIVGSYDEINNIVEWSVYKDPTSNDVDCVVTLHLLYGISPESCFTLSTNKDYFAPTYIIHDKEGNLIRGDKRSYLFKHEKILRSDPRIDTLKFPDEWGTAVIPYDLTTISIDCGLPQIRKWGIQTLFRLDNITNVSVQPYSINDDNPVPIPLTPIRYRLNMTWGDPDIVWGNAAYRWNWKAMIEQRRRLPAGTIRFSEKILSIKNAYLPIYNSDVYGAVNTDSSTKIVTKLAGSLPWPEDLLDYTITFEVDNYSYEYPILERVSDTELLVSDPSNYLQNIGNAKWLIKGYPKNEAVSVSSLVLYYIPMTATQPTYYGTSSETGLNSG